MFISLLIIFGVAVMGMAVIPLRHVAEAERSEEPITDGEVNSVARVYVERFVDRVDTWARWNAREEALKILDRGLKIFERMAGRVAGQTKNMRLMVQERFKVIPRESLYWKQVHAWKKANGNGNGNGMKREFAFAEEEGDISNHS